MVPFRKIVEHVLAEPFQPFRIHMASGRIFEVRHPDMVGVGKSTMIVYAPPENDPDGPVRWEKIPYTLIDLIAPMKVTGQGDEGGITYQKIGSHVTAEPFRPFRIQMSSGRTFEIRHPEMVQVGRNTMTIFTFLSDNPEEAKERQVEVSLLLIETIEPLNATVQTQRT